MKPNKSLNMSLLMLMSMMFIMGLASMLLIYLNKSILLDWQLLSISTTMMSFQLILDPVGTSFSTIVLLISSSVVWFSIYYMDLDPFKSRFIMMIMAFVASMNLLIFIPNLITLLLGWDGLGVVSFALVIYYQNHKSLAAGMITALSNRVGDMMILIAISLTVTQGHWNIMSMWNSPMSFLVALCLMLAAMTKSAQIPFSAWLPAAMAAPTPVSALVHSSTLVTAGVFLLIRFFYFLNETPSLISSLLFIATMTTLMAGISANMETDLKKIIALSTLSQLGVMMSSLALSLPLLALFHLYTHAMFKALLFLCAGKIIHCNSDNQDIRKMGKIWSQLPVTTTHLNIANLSLCGAPFMSGFYSKDLILESFLFSNTNLMLILLMFFATGLTSMYSFRLSAMTLWDHMKSKPNHQNTEEEKNTLIPMTILSFLAVLGGFIMQKTMLTFTTPIFISLHQKLLTPMVILSGLYLGSQMFNQKMLIKSDQTTKYFLTSMWFLPDISTQGALALSIKNLKKPTKILDQGWLESMTTKTLKSSLKNLISFNYKLSSISTPNHQSIILISTMTILIMSQLAF
uniref:NADH dehydrogenase subunit 5 n=1 Tax=Cellana toreuma TaxID=42758 RepID=UPI0020289A56|nr:NADH dehydrogenase subunit 5 [Cellana toreuma]UPX89402.1 NADH dehydrogenase subunit 5 [Cellana toreuma]